ncbi:amidophosphoribosyltransferase [Acinetobacter junii]|uniref:amidophosphoribosyltransferase n=1 Tax=Acinetobacter junii TaxID=40215 RepID=UPI0012504385|nr:amidophosphoribosyltransferase [Acinetobacter junii]MQZ56731.1 amidophosphoribosyltransferase [Acinetobacter junii]
MKEFEIDGQGWYTVRGTDTRRPCQFLTKKVIGYYHDDYHSANNEKRTTEGTVEFVITTLKNQFNEKGRDVLHKAIENLAKILRDDFPQIMTGNDMAICVIPRAKVENNYQDNQLLFKKVVSVIAKELKYIDGTDYILRHTDTCTTHLARSGYGGNGDMPYPGITKATCTISNEVKGKDILLVDDLYTPELGIDDDAIQALFDHGASSVIFYSIGKTLK